MLVILKETTRKLGRVGDVVKVRPGFARNFLLPTKRAVRANSANLAVLEKEKGKIKAQQDLELEHAKRLSDLICAIDVLPVFARVESGKLFGSVGAKQITSALLEKEIEISQKNLVLPTPIKESGEHDVKVFLHTEISCALKIHILDLSKKTTKTSDDTKV